MHRPFEPTPTIRTVMWRDHGDDLPSQGERLRYRAVTGPEDRPFCGRAPAVLRRRVPPLGPNVTGRIGQMIIAQAIVTYDGHPA